LGDAADFDAAEQVHPRQVSFLDWNRSHHAPSAVPVPFDTVDVTRLFEDSTHLLYVGRDSAHTRRRISPVLKSSVSYHLQRRSLPLVHHTGMSFAGLSGRSVRRFSLVTGIGAIFSSDGSST
jgi:hypothetical protein